MSGPTELARLSDTKINGIICICASCEISIADFPWRVEVILQSFGKPMKI
ncbi:MAG: hypothetical protein WCD89_25075 [Anaerocolumna sp.]